MTTTHVFIVDDDTFPIHLEYMFAGTGAKDKENHMGLLSDIKRVRPGDKVIFYLQRTAKYDGGFFGVFKIKDHKPFVFFEPKGKYLIENLKKQLIYRTLIEPDEVFSRPISEWEALDSLPPDNNSKNILWSLIYRKLRANRGCSPINLEESERLIDLIKKNNEEKSFKSDKGYTFDKEKREIIIGDKKEYSGEVKEIKVFPELKKKYNENKAFEVELQTLFTENSGSGFLKEITGNKEEIIWLGNEVACGVGMQKIDVFTILNKNGKREFKIIELKDEQINPKEKTNDETRIIYQLKRYVNWVEQYVNGAIKDNMQPIIVAKKIPNTSSNKVKRKKFNNQNKLTPFFKEIKQELHKFNSYKLSLPVKYFEYEIIGDKINFEEIIY